ncbi:hypothetical protein GA0061099_1004449 [Bradyrhizobium yuanmingense]|uniref:Uncharacterized protein n=2 Tax=Bradyrhizobium yuanmingense TaxID=108015 RepID=A0A1C3VS51_9BRAD|nr:hypothetical protein IQ15_02208 [Bradyrhizobium yuanmingense]SCB30334.1 hypothetical protein GA0061099_1004449 [Bradyrhizobium yuanmingense]
MSVILTTSAEVNICMTAPAEEALKLIALFRTNKLRHAGDSFLLETIFPDDPMNFLTRRSKR